MELKNRFIIKALVGFILGLIVGIGFWILFSDGNGSVSDFIFYEFMSGLLGLVANGSSIVYEIESWGIRTATIVHYLFCMIAFTSIALILGWFDVGWTLVIMLAAMTVAYIFIWLFQSFYWKKTIRQMNEDLKKMNHKEDGSEEQ